eukprot:2747850-Pleurochrysis_carterae.AAC.1
MRMRCRRARVCAREARRSRVRRGVRGAPPISQPAEAAESERERVQHAMRVPAEVEVVRAEQRKQEPERVRPRQRLTRHGQRAIARGAFFLCSRSNLCLRLPLLGWCLATRAAHVKEITPARRQRLIQEKARN